MAVWLTHGPCTVGLDDGLIKARDFARLVDSGEVAAGVEQERARILAEAQAQAQQLLQQAHLQADSVLGEAEDRYAAAHAQGFEQGLQDAAAEWAAQAIDVAESRRRALLRQSERLSAIVSMAVERVIENEDRAGLFRRSLRTIVKLVKDVSMLTMRVPVADVDSARRAVDTLLLQHGNELNIEVLADPHLPAGGCRFESDGGVIDAGLETQLAALRRAVSRVAHQMAQESDADFDAGLDLGGEAAAGAASVSDGVDADTDPDADIDDAAADPHVHPEAGADGDAASEAALADDIGIDDADEGPPTAPGAPRHRAELLTD